MMKMRANIITQRKHIMNSRETLILKTLQCKALHSGADNARFVDHLLDQNPEQADAITKNVCARIPKLLSYRMEQVVHFLPLSNP